jgi:hypothetical protein
MGAAMSYSYLALLYQTIQANNPMIPVCALAIKKLHDAGDTAGAEQRRDAFEDAHGAMLAVALDTCILFLRMYGDVFEV